ncbi:unnamed protein product [Colletotrichum noveboracense]|uniref:T6SS Phospholipase effector Tle1-like catalytic domain-containing protein n=1 Tax=Colletotrichum noveboracense TaxID=2664923 RepID=A0A9W4RTS7_9PEZI|nr:unnamed protein product [Colletotrichum noveboracense]
MDETSTDWVTEKPEIEEAIDEIRREWFEKIIKLGVEGGVDAMAEKYAKKLSKCNMIVCDGKMQNGKWVAEKVEVKAVGVWDTVGSLGMPYNPLQIGRGDSEIRFGTQDVHKRIQHAFHALALDKYRKPFKPTLWSRHHKNKNTHLRQVWFPGSHSDVGGGSANQQIATISFAWMADQLSSVGVEFSSQEMTRIFRTVDLEVKPREWGLGPISSADFWTKLADKTVGKITHIGEAAYREPGLCTEDNNPLSDRLKNTNELVHPSVRLRYLFKEGLGLDDKGEWECEALSSSYYILQRLKKPRHPWIKRPNQSYLSTHRTLSGDVSSIHGGTNIAFMTKERSHSVVAKQLPFESDLNEFDIATWRWDMPYCGPPDNQKWEPRAMAEEQVRQDGEVMNDFKARNHERDDDLQQDDEPQPPEDPEDRWVWVRPKPEPEKDDDNLNRKIELHKERIGLWERQYMMINKQNMDRENEWQHKRNPDLGLWGGFVSAASGQLNRVGRIGKKALNAGYQVAATAGALPQKMYKATAGRFKLVWSPTASVSLWGTAQSKKDIMNKLTKLHPTIDPAKYTCEDIVAWQHGDLRIRSIHNRAPGQDA